jgi:hypothetical protein
MPCQKFIFSALPTCQLSGLLGLPCNMHLDTMHAYNTISSKYAMLPALTPDGHSVARNDVFCEWHGRESRFLPGVERRQIPLLMQHARG